MTTITLAGYVLALPLELEDTGPEVEALQRCLVERNYLDTSTFGYFGSKTKAAVLLFQQESGLLDDGVVGSETARALNCPELNSALVSAAPYYSSEPSSFDSEIYSSPVGEETLTLNDRGPAVVALQNRLTDLGYDPGPVDGEFGSRTQQAVIQFQLDRNLEADGVVGSATWARLGGFPNSSIAFETTGGRGERVWPAEEFSVLELQRRLKARGFYPGPLDGSMGPGTQRAIAAAQRFYGVSDRDVRNGRF
ncbi:MAG TPA: peptidoglycan-binding protein [Allocoleopsis sp.]